MKKLFLLLSFFALAISCENKSGGTDPEPSATEIKFLTPSPFAVSGDKGTAQIQFDVTASWSAEVEGGDGWCTLAQSEGEAGKGVSLTLNLEENGTGVSRSAGIKIRSEKKSASLILTQDEVTKIEILGEPSATIIGSGGEILIEFSSTKSWEASVTEGAEWCSLDTESGEEGDDLAIVATVQRNIGEGRDAQIMLSSSGKEYFFDINQGAKTMYTFRVGDYYPFPEDAESAFGIVFKVDGEGRHGKYVSIAEGYGKEWGLIGKIEANDMSNGLNNMATVKAMDATYEYFDAFRWVDSLNNFPKGNVYKADAIEVWYLPAFEELQELYSSKSEVNFSMEAISEPLFQEEYPNAYWSSTEGTEASAAVLHFANGMKDYAGKIVGDCRWQRAVARF